MSTHNIVVFGGDHCGPEVVAEAVKATLQQVIKAIESASPSAGKFNLQDHPLGGSSIDAHGTPLTEAALAAAKAADAVLLGAIGGPEWGTGAVRPEQGILQLRKELGTYGNLRPCFFPSDVLVDYSPLKADVCRGTDFTIVRELTGGIYFGERKEPVAGTDGKDGVEGADVAWDTELYTRPEIERVTRLAARLALARTPPAPVWSLDKANVLASSRLWRRVVSETMAREFPQLELRHQLIDSAALLLVKNPRSLNGIIVTGNLFGDIISDQASAIPGSIGLSPSASLAGLPDGKARCNGIYEPIHGSAPDISGKGIVNPLGTILSVAMMFRYSLALPREADAVETAVKNVIEAGIRTKELGGSAGTTEVGDAVVAEVIKILKA
ncbi:3-isopropylmalate dehydrogenase [Durotheca rogersii]|uniref:3-isopropylmalate dehydrogenase n=1 Tax=Durotheca rogersii TaxID=419775 RepID=UPI00221FCD72|nr:3-isopropylmalate dehydrogenase [Durotheca rogersii]KAI5864515.1 3-isopropylmalate dehydrogenase [Durotheca rogersii]